MKKILTFLMAIALILVPVKAFADDELTVGYEIVEEDYEEEYYDDDEDYDYDDEEYYDDYDDEDYDYEYYDDDVVAFDEAIDLVDEEKADEENKVSLSVCNVVLLATVPFIAGLLVGAGVMLLSYKTVKKEEVKKKDNKKDDK